MKDLRLQIRGQLAIDGQDTHWWRGCIFFEHRESVCESAARCFDFFLASEENKNVARWMTEVDG